MSKKQLRIIRDAAGLAMLLFGGIAAFGWLSKVIVFAGVTATQIAAGLSVLAGIARGWAAGQLPPSKVKLPSAGTGVLFVALLGVLVALALPACKASPVKIAGQTIRHVQQARDLFAAQLASAMRAKRAECIRKHGAKTAGYAECVKQILEIQSKWKRYSRPVIDTSCSVANTALKTNAFVDACKKAKDCHKRVIAFLRLGYCAISRGLKALGHLFPDKGQSVLSTLTSLEGVICGD